MTLLVAVGAAAAGVRAERILAVRLTTLLPRGVEVRLVVSEVDRPSGHVALYLTLYRKAATGWFRQSRARAPVDGTRRSRLLSLTITRARAPNTSIARLRWLISAAAGTIGLNYALTQSGLVGPVQ